LDDVVEGVSRRAAAGAPYPSRRRAAGWLLSVLLGLTLVWGVQADEPGFAVLDVYTALKDGVYLLSADIEYRLGERPKEALRSGVPLTVRVTMEVAERRRFLWDRVVATLEQGYRLSYHDLSRQYQVENLNTSVRESFPSVEAALASMGRLRDFPLIDRELLDEDERYLVNLQAELDIEALPAPLRPVAYVSPAWHLGSRWHSVPLTP
jgi:hypothetical protein